MPRPAIIQSVAPLPVTRGLQLYLDMKLGAGTDVLPDLSPNTLAQTLSTGRPTWTEQGMGFAGSQYLDLGVEALGSTGLFAASGQTFTVAAVVSVTGSGTIIGRAGATAGSRTFQLLRNTSAQYQVNTRGSAFSFGPNDALWHMIAARWNGTTMHVFSDGGAAVAASLGTAAEETGQRIGIGARTNVSANFLNGGVSLLLVYDQALTDDEIRYGLYAWARDLVRTRGITLP